MSNYDVVVVGAGLSGLTAARHLHSRGVRTLVIEKDDAPGGRIRTDHINGFQLDRGFQVLLTAYPEAVEQLDYDRLDLKSFVPGAVVWDGADLRRVVDPLRDIIGGARTLVEPVGTLADKARVAKLRYRVTRGDLSDLMSRPETWTFNALRANGFSGDMISTFFRPFLAGVFLESELETSSRFFEFVFRMFAKGDAALPSAGMQAIPDQVARSLPPGMLRTSTQVDTITNGVVRLAGGEQISTDNVLVATEGPESARLLGWPAPMPGKSVTTIYYSSPEPPISEPVLVLNGSGKGLVNNLCVPDQVSHSYASDGRSLVSVSIIGLPQVTGSLDETVKSELQEWFGPLAKHFTHVHTYRIPYALPDQSPGVLEPVEKPAVVAPGIYVCGDHRDTASINGALASGRRAAEAILSA